MLTPDKCRSAREKLGLTQTELARRANIHRLTVWRFEHGWYKDNSVSTITAIMGVFAEAGIFFPAT
jgi:predicted transcriptional regulator